MQYATMRRFLASRIKPFMLTRDFDYHLPPELIAQRPLAERTASRLLVLRDDQTWQDQVFTELPSLLQPGDLLVFNNTRVFPARLFGQKESGGKVEVLIERILSSRDALAHVRASKSPQPGSMLQLVDGTPVRVLDRQGEFFQLQFTLDGALLDYLEGAGQVPLPPYIERGAEDLDRERYQTVYAAERGAVAAPTAGLHFDQALLQQLEKLGIARAFVTLHVGAGTFQPVRVERIEDHRLHAEHVAVTAAVCEQIKQTKASGGRVIAVGTTVVRSLEAAASCGHLQAFAGDTRLYITPGFEFQLVDALITNFHLPRSSLLMLVCAFAGYEFVMQAYRHAVEQAYRFFSYGDAMYIERGKEKGKRGKVSSSEV